MEDLQPLLPRKIPQSIFPPIAPALSNMDPMSDNSGLLGSISTPAPNVTLNPLLRSSAGDPHVARIQDLYADADRHTPNPVAPTTTLGKIGHVASRVGNVLGDIFAPGVMSAIPGTQLGNERIVDRDLGQIQKESQQQTEEAERAQLGAKTDAARPFEVTPEMATAAGVPELAGQSVSQQTYQKLFGATKIADSRETVGAGHDATRIATTGMNNDAKAAVAAQKPIQRDDHYISVMEKAPGDRTPEDLAFKSAYESLINTKTTEPGIAKAVAYGQNRPVQVVLPGGQAGYTTAGNAIRTGATSLGDNTYKAAGSALKDFTSGTDSHTLTAFNTAKGHLQQLAEAGDALQNGDVQALNKLANAYGTATGNSAPVVFQGVKTAVSGEIAKAFTGAGATVDEINEIRQSINDANSPAQLHDVVSSYSHLLDTKSRTLRDQFNSAKQGKPNFSQDSSPKVKKFNAATGRLE